MLPDVLTQNLSVVFCGTAVGEASAQRGAYYAGPGNRFWPTLHEVGFTPRKLEPEQFAAIVEYGLGLTDLAKGIAGADSVLRDEHFDRQGLQQKMLRFRPMFLAFTSKRAAEEYLGFASPYGLLPQVIEQTKLFVLPSPSGAARKHWSVEPWKELAVLAKTERA